MIVIWGFEAYLAGFGSVGFPVVFAWTQRCGTATTHITSLKIIIKTINNENYNQYTNATDNANSSPIHLQVRYK